MISKQAFQNMGFWTTYFQTLRTKMVHRTLYFDFGHCISKHLVFITQYPNFVGPTTSCFVWMSFESRFSSLNHSEKWMRVTKTENCFQVLKTKTQWQSCKKTNLVGPILLNCLYQVRPTPPTVFFFFFLSLFFSFLSSHLFLWTSASFFFCELEHNTHLT